MNCYTDRQSWLELAQNCLSRVIRPCIVLVPCMKRRQQVYPTVSNACPGDQFIKLSQRRQVRVIHLDSSSLCGSRAPESHHFRAKHRSLSPVSSCSELSEEYWFTRWNRPLRMSEACNCSFRKSWRNLLGDSRVAVNQIEEDRKCGDRQKMLSSSILHVETFVEELLQEVWNEVFSCLSQHCSTEPSRSNDYNLISCRHSPSDDCIKQVISDNFEKTSQQVDTSVGCVNPLFLGSNSDPDLLGYCHSASPKTVVQTEDTDSGFNTVSLQSTNETDVPVASSNDNESDPSEVVLSITQPNNSVLAKDNAQDYIQSTLTSVDVKLLGCENTNSKSQDRSNVPCYHTRNIRRLKPLLYFLHGVGCSADLWSSLLQYFTAAGYEVVAPDMLGHGYSDAPDSAAAYTFHRLLKDAIDIFDRFVAEHRKCVVIGHAYGCSLAAAVARYRAQQVSHLVLISGGGPAPLAPRTADSRPPSVSPCLQTCLKPLVMCGFRRNILYAARGKHIESCPSMSEGVPRYVLHHVAQGQDWPEGDATFHRRILVPTLLVHGLQDPYVTLVQECEMERTIPRSFLELIPNAGHLSMLETPTQLSHMIHCFIDWWSR